MFCRKCGNKKTTKRSAGVFHCKHCGMQPGQSQMDRFGNKTVSEQLLQNATTTTEYVFAVRQPRLRAGISRG